MKTEWIFAYRHNGEYKPEGIFPSWDAALEGVEYADVLHGEYQLWEYPSGVQYDIVPDRELTEDNWTTCSPETWMPELVRVATKRHVVLSAYKAKKAE